MSEKIIEDDDVLKAIKLIIEGKTLEASNVLLESMSAKKIEPKSLMLAGAICNKISEMAPHYTGYSRGAKECADRLIRLGTLLGKHLDEFGRP